MNIVYRVQILDFSLNRLKNEYKSIGLDSGEISPFLENKIEPEESMLLSASSGRLIALCLEAPELEQEIERAVKQVEKALTGEEELMEEKRSIDAATKHSEVKGWSWRQFKGN